MTPQELAVLRDELALYLTSHIPKGVGCVLLLVGEDGSFSASRNITTPAMEELLRVMIEDGDHDTKIIRKN